MTHRFDDVQGLARASGAGWASWLSLTVLLSVIVACGSSDPVGPARTDTPRTVAAAAPGPATDLGGHPVIARVEPRQHASFALLRTPPEPLPARVRRTLREPIMGMNWDLAQRLPVASSGAYWLVPGSGQLCIVDQGSLGNPAVGTACTSTDEALEHGIASVTVAMPRGPGQGAESRLIVGVAPDGVGEVRVRTRGAVATLSVTRTTFVLRDALAAPPDEISWR